METTSIAAATTGSTTAAGAGAKELTDQFLTLLVAQLKNQDPTNPIENQEFVSELAQLQSLEQQQKLTATNQSLLLQSSLATGSSMIGKEVTGNVVFAGQLIEISGVVESLKLENGVAVYRVRTDSGEVHSMNADDLKTVSAPIAEQSVPASTI